MSDPFDLPDAPDVDPEAAAAFNEAAEALATHSFASVDSVPSGPDAFSPGLAEVPTADVGMSSSPDEAGAANQEALEAFGEQSNQRVSEEEYFAQPHATKSANPGGQPSTTEISRAERSGRNDERIELGVGPQDTREDIRGQASAGTDLRTGAPVYPTVGTLPQRARSGGPAALLTQTLVSQGPVSERTARILEATTAQAAEMRNRANELAAAGLMEEANALDDEADNRLREAIEFKAAAKDAEQDVAREIGKLQNIVDAIGSRQIDPNRLFTNTSSSNRFAAAFAIAAGALSQAQNPGTQNAALQIINSAVERDLQAQALDVQRLSTQASQQRGAIQTLSDSYENEQAAMHAARALRFSQAAAMMGAQARRHEGAQGWQNFLMAEAEMRRQAAAAQAAAEQGAFQQTLQRRLPMSRGQSGAIINAHLGIQEPARPRSGRRSNGGTQQATRGIDQLLREADRTGQVVLPEMDEAAVNALVRALPNEYTPYRRDDGQVIIRRTELMGQFSQQELQEQLARSGRQFAGFNLASDQYAALQTAYPGEKLGELAGEIRTVRTIGRALERLRRMEQAGWETFGNERARSEAISSILQPLVGTALGLGALAEADLEIVEGVIQDPLDIMNPTAIPRLEAAYETFSNDVFQPLRDVGIDVDE